MNAELDEALVHARKAQDHEARARTRVKQAERLWSEGQPLAAADYFEGAGQSLRAAATEHEYAMKKWEGQMEAVSKLLTSRPVRTDA